MNRIIVKIIIYLDKVPNLEKLLPQEQAIAKAWKEEGILEHSFGIKDRSGVVLIFKDIDEPKAKELIQTLPLLPYFENIEYTTVVKHF